jgi:hypothetical protein
MTTIEELRAALDAAQQGTPDAAVETAVTVYQVAAAWWTPTARSRTLQRR